jgi:hypothetical protein
LKASRDLPPLLATPDRHYLTLYVLWLQEKRVLLGVVVTEGRHTFRGHTDKSVYYWSISLRRQAIDHIANPQGPVPIGHDLHHLRLAQSGIHAGTDIDGEEHGPRSVPVASRLRPYLVHTIQDRIN